MRCRRYPCLLLLWLVLTFLVNCRSADMTPPPNGDQVAQADQPQPATATQTPSFTPPAPTSTTPPSLAPTSTHTPTSDPGRTVRADNPGQAVGATPILTPTAPVDLPIIQTFTLSPTQVNAGDDVTLT
jgi:hypothetical protein